MSPRAFRHALTGAISCFLLALGACCATTTTASAASTFGIIDLGIVGEYGGARAINANGQVLAFDYSSGTGAQPFLWHPGGVRQYLTEEPGQQLSVFALNNLGQVVGRLTIQGETNSQGFVWQDGTMTALPELLYGADINDNGLIVGRALDANNAGVSALYDLNTSTAQLIENYKGYSTAANAINANGDFVGSYTIVPYEVNNALAWIGGDVISIDADATPWCTLLDINDNGLAVGYVGDEPGVRPFLWSQESGVTDIGFAPTSNPASIRMAINNHGVVVSQYDFDDFTTHGYMYFDGTFTDLNDLLPADSPWTLLNAVDINDRGQIVGIGEIDGERHVYLMQIPAPAVLSMLGVAFMFGHRHSRRP